MKNEPYLAVSLVRELSLFDLETLEKEEILEQGVHTNISRIHVSPCGRILVTEDKLQVSIWDIAQKQKVLAVDMYNPLVLNLTSEMMHIRHFKSKKGKRKTMTKGKILQDEFEETIIDFYESETLSGIHG